MPKQSVIERRWEAGTPHHPEAIRLLKAMAKLDTEDEAGFKFGGDGDNGEILLYLLSEVLERDERVEEGPE